MDGIVESTETIFTVEREVRGYPLRVGVKRIGEDLLISVEGGTKAAYWLCDSVHSTSISDR